MEEMTVEQAAKATGYNKEWLRRLIREGKLVARKRSSIWFINSESLRKYVKDQGRRLYAE